MSREWTEERHDAILATLIADETKYDIVNPDLKGALQEITRLTDVIKNEHKAKIFWQNMASTIDSKLEALKLENASWKRLTSQMEDAYRRQLNLEKAEIERLNDELAGTTIYCAEMKRQRDAVLIENEKLLNLVKLYADKNNWNQEDCHHKNTPRIWGINDGEAGYNQAYRYLEVNHGCPDCGGTGEHSTIKPPEGFFPCITCRGTGERR